MIRIFFCLIIEWNAPIMGGGHVTFFGTHPPRVCLWRKVRNLAKLKSYNSIGKRKFSKVRKLKESMGGADNAHFLCLLSLSLPTNARTPLKAVPLLEWGEKLKLRTWNCIFSFVYLFLVFVSLLDCDGGIKIDAFNAKWLVVFHGWFLR